MQFSSIVDMQTLNYWSVIECQIAIICACLPTARAFLVHIFPGTLSFSADHVSSDQQYKIRQAHHPEEKRQISKTISCSVDYNEMQQMRESSSFVHLVEVRLEKE